MHGRMLMRSIGSLALVIVATAGGCMTDDGAADEDSDGLVTRTIVRLDGASATVVRAELVTRAEVQADHAQAAAGAPQPLWSALQPRSCGAATLALFDDLDYTGNEICFYGDGWVYLRDYHPYCDLVFCPTWENNIRSFKAGAQAGSFLRHHQQGDIVPGDPETPFRAWEAEPVTYFKAYALGLVAPPSDPSTIPWIH
jgi:hypothetical protein